MTASPSTTETKSAGSLPIFYARPELLTSERHSGKSLAKTSGHIFARRTNSVPLNGVEFAVAQRNYPIVFSEEGAPFPVAILGLRSDENLFLGANGEWEKGAYIPAYVRRYPFVFMAAADQKQFALCIEMDPEHVIEGDSNPFFRGGEPTDVTRNALAFCSSFQAEYERTRAFAAALVEHQLLESRTADVALGGERKFVFGPFKVVDEGKLADLPNAVIADLLRKGWLAWIHAHSLSFANWASLAQRLSAPG